MVAAAMLMFLSLAFPQATDLCSDCDSTGRVEFELPKDVAKREVGVRYCSEVLEQDGLNHGLDYLPCPDCHIPAKQADAEEEYKQHQEDADYWLEDRRSIDAFLNDRRLEAMHVSTEHFEITWTIPKVKVGRKTFKQHDAMHLYAQRLESVYKRYLEQFGLSHWVEQNAVRHNIMCFEMQRHSTVAMPKYAKIGGTGSQGGKLLGVESVFVTWWDKTKNRNDEEFHEYVMHNAVHLFLASSFNYHWFGMKQGWLDAGFSHYFTEREFGVARTHCYQEQHELQGWVMKKWRPEVRKLVISRRAPSFSEAINRHIEELDATQHLATWSWVQFLIDGHTPEQWVTFVKIMKHKKPVREAMKEAYGYTMLEFTDKWMEFVMETYPPK